MSQNDADEDREHSDERVIQAALTGHLQYLSTAEDAHRRVAGALTGRKDVLSSQENPITLAAAHRARCASFAQRGEFLEQLVAFPAAGLRALTAQDMRTLQVPAHIGAAAVPEELGQQITDRETRTRLAGARSAAGRGTDQDGHDTGQSGSTQ